jgi:hypothetical protein
MKRTHARRGLRVTLTVLGVGLLTAVISAAGGLAHAVGHRSSQAPKACVSKADMVVSVASSVRYP